MIYIDLWYFLEIYIDVSSLTEVAELAGPCLQLLRQLDLRAQEDLCLEKLLTLLAQQPGLESEVALCRKCWGLQPKRKRENEKLLNEVNVLGELEPCVDEFFKDPFAA